MPQTNYTGELSTARTTLLLTGGLSLRHCSYGLLRGPTRLPARKPRPTGRGLSIHALVRDIILTAMTLGHSVASLGAGSGMPAVLDGFVGLAHAYPTQHLVASRPLVR